MNKLLRMNGWAVLFFVAAASEAFSAEGPRIVATTSNLASLTREITGAEAEIHFVASPKRDVHFIQPTPKDVLKVKKADVLIHGGLDLEAWRDPLLDAAGNKKLIGASAASIDAAQGIELLDVPDRVSRAEGDIHLFGNPHYWLDPENGKIMAKNIADGLSRLYPDHADFYRENYEAFAAKADQAIQDWNSRMKPFAGTSVITYHRDWPYFAARFHLKVVEEIEPKPGIPPSPRHLSELSDVMKEKKVRLIITNSYQETRTPKKVAASSGAKVVVLCQAVGEFKEVEDYLGIFEYNIRVLEEALTYA